jgi:hypothetical protein
VNYRFSADIAARAWPILDDEWLTEPLRRPLADQARDNIGPAAGRIADDDAHRPRRIGLRACDARKGRERSSSGGQTQKLTAMRFHGPPNKF